MIDYSQEARTYALMTLFVLVSASGLLLMLRQIEAKHVPKRLASMLFAGGAVLAFYAHFCSVFWIVPAVALLLFVAGRQGTVAVQRRVTVILTVMALAAASGVLRLVRSLRGAIEYHWLPHATPAQFLATIGEQLLPTGR